METWRAIVSAELMGIKMVVEWLIAMKYGGEVVMLRLKIGRPGAPLHPKGVRGAPGLLGYTYTYSQKIWGHPNQDSLTVGAFSQGNNRKRICG